MKDFLQKLISDLENTKNIIEKLLKEAYKLAAEYNIRPDNIKYDINSRRAEITKQISELRRQAESQINMPNMSSFAGGMGWPMMRPAKTEPDDPENGS